MPLQDSLPELAALRSHPINASAHPNFGHHGEHQDWPFIRLLLVTGVATFASVGNIFTVSAIIVDELLQKKGNTFLVSMTLADMLVTTLVLPASAAAILAEMENSENLCRFQYGVSSIGCVTAAVSIAAMGIENYLRLRNLRRADDVRTCSITSATMVTGLTEARSGLRRPPKTSVCTVAQVTVLNLLIWLFSGLMVLMHFSLMPELMYEICRYQDRGADYQYRMLMSLTLLTLFILISILLGGLGLLKAVSVMRAWDKPKPYFTAREFAVVWANFWNWLLRLCILGPCLVIAITSQAQKIGEQQEEEFPGRRPGFSSKVQNPNDPPTAFQRLVIWAVIIPPCCACIVNACANKDFRLRYKQLFHYCCCKTSVAVARRRGDTSRGGSDVRVHIIPGYNMYSSATTGHFSETTASASFGSRGFKCRPFMHYKRDVYEL